MQLECAVASRDARKAQNTKNDEGIAIPRRLLFGIRARVVECPEEILIGLPTLRSTGLLAAVLDGGSTPPENPEAIYEEDPEGAIPTEFIDPSGLYKMAGTPEEQRRVRELINEFSELFGPSPIDASVTPFGPSITPSSQLLTLPLRGLWDEESDPASPPASASLASLCHPPSPCRRCRHRFMHSATPTASNTDSMPTTTTVIVVPPQAPPAPMRW